MEINQTHFQWRKWCQTCWSIRCLFFKGKMCVYIFR